MLEPRIDEIELVLDGKMHTQRVVYENFPKFCCHCHRTGNVKEMCYWLKPEEEREELFRKRREEIKQSKSIVGQNLNYLSDRDLKMQQLQEGSSKGQNILHPVLVLSNLDQQRNGTPNINGSLVNQHILKIATDRLQIAFESQGIEENILQIGAEESDSLQIGAEETNRLQIALESQGTEENRLQIGVEESEKLQIGADEADRVQIDADEVDILQSGVEEADIMQIATEEADRNRIATEEADRNRLQIGVEESGKLKIGADEAGRVQIDAVQGSMHSITQIPKESNPQTSKNIEESHSKDKQPCFDNCREDGLIGHGNESDQTQKDSESDGGNEEIQTDMILVNSINIDLRGQLSEPEKEEQASNVEDEVLKDGKILGTQKKLMEEEDSKLRLTNNKGRKGRGRPKKQ